MDKIDTTTFLWNSYLDLPLIFDVLSNFSMSSVEDNTDNLSNQASCSRLKLLETTFPLFRNCGMTMSLFFSLQRGDFCVLEHKISGKKEMTNMYEAFSFRMADL